MSTLMKEVSTISSHSSIDEALTAILRGAAKILGCNSANFLVFNTPRQRIRAQVGITVGKENELRGVEKLFGISSLSEHEFTYAQARNTIIYKAWQERRAIEAESLVELAEGAFPQVILKGIDALIGKHRFIVVPVIGPINIYGVIVFEKNGHYPFSAQQREVLLRYAQRIGEIIENDTKSSLFLSSRHDERTGYTARRENALQNQLLQIALGSPAPAVMLDTEFRITSCNEATVALLGYTDKELVGRDIGMLFPPNQNIYTILNHQFLFFSDGRYEEPATVRDKKGSLIPCLIEALLLADGEGRVIGFLILLRNDAQRQDFGRNDPYRQERLASMGEMAAQLAHEIRNPLLAIGATIDSLVHDREENDPDLPVLRTLSNEIVRLDMILRDYLSLAVRQNTSISRINLAALVRDVSVLLTGMQKMAGKRIDLDLPGDLWILTDYEGMKHVIFNLMLNALEATPPHGVISCRIQENNSTATIIVEDNGPGLPANAEDLFAPFYTTKKNGTGLGLTVCKKIVESHNGSIRLENKPEGGCRAIVSLPRRTAT